MAAQPRGGTSKKMNDQTKHRADETTPLQGKVILEPSVSVASEERPPAPAQLLEEASFERLDELDQRQRVGVEIVDERLALGDGRRLDLEDVGKSVADDLEDLVAFEWGGVSWHGRRV